MKGFLWGVNVPKQLHFLLKLFGPLANQGRIYGHFGKCANVKLSFHSQALSNLLSVLSVWERESCDQIFMLQRIHAWSTVFFLSWNTLFSLQLYGLLFFATSFDLIVETQIVWLFVQCCNQFDVTSKSELSLAHSTAGTKILQKTSNKEIQSFTSVNLFGFLRYVSNTIN